MLKFSLPSLSFSLQELIEKLQINTSKYVVLSISFDDRNNFVKI
jgi:hypothetical protein